MNPFFDYRFSERKPSAYQNYLTIEGWLKEINAANIMVRRCFVRTKTIRGSDGALSAHHAKMMHDDVKHLMIANV